MLIDLASTKKHQNVRMKERMLHVSCYAMALCRFRRVFIYNLVLKVGLYEQGQYWV